LLPTIAIGNHQVTRLTIGGNPFSGFSHQTPERDAAMLDYYTTERIKQVLFECQEAGINTCCLRTDAHIWRMLREFRNEGGALQWIAQMGVGADGFEANVLAAADHGAIAYYIHGAVTDECYKTGDYGPIARMIDFIHEQGLLAGLDGAASIGGLQLAYRLFDDKGNCLTDGLLESEAWTAFQSSG